MRDCPICHKGNKRVLSNDYGGESAINAGLGPLGWRLCLFECVECGFHYVDSLKLSQEWLDTYYLERYATDDKPYSDERLSSLADEIAAYKPIRMLDIGGADRELTSRLFNREVMADYLGPRAEPQLHAYGGVVLSHTLEHIYDLSSIFNKIRLALEPGGLLFIEVPSHPDAYLPADEYDNHWQHINKFRAQDIELLLLAEGFRIIKIVPIPEYREYKCLRALSRLD